VRALGPGNESQRGAVTGSTQKNRENKANSVGVDVRDGQ
jgi:hypothetical protein